MSKISRFAHFLGRSSMAADEDERDENAEDEDEDQQAKKAKGRKAEEDNDDPDAEEEDDSQGSEDDDTDHDASEDDDDEGAEDGDDDKEAKAVKKGRNAERDRCARIFSSKHAANNPALAATLAFDTGMSSAQAIKIMSATGGSVRAEPKPGRVSLDQRMAGIKKIQLGQDKKPDDASTPKGKVAHMTHLYNRVKGVK